MKKVFKGIKYEKYYKDILPYLKKQKNQEYFMAILTLGATICFALFAINPTLSTIVKLRKEVEDSRIVHSALKNKVINLSNLITEYSVIQKDLPLVLDAIPEQPQAPTLIGQIQTIAQSSNVAIEKLDISEVGLTEEGASTSSKFSFELTGTSTYESLNAFISELILMQRIVSLETISLTKNADSETLQLDLKGSAYYKKQ
ncbi:MAG: type 4a pilus biogenesis protein PilO [Candidatus Levybacteria bacterium]|nr:type 4a pilus biogenesis protein PilO [Candidatus Levybacteria bacterium]